MEKIMKAFVWQGTEVVNGGHCLVAWSQVQRPLELGGLGILDPKLFGQALRLRWLWLARTDPTRAWSLMPIEDDGDTCVVSREVWFKVLRRMGWQQLAPSPHDSMVDWWIEARKRVAKACRRAFDSLVVLVVWSLWVERNARVFRQRSKSTTALATHVLDELDWWCRAGSVDRSRCFGE
ncbi:hypothetical protein PR202_gb20530 [Eleusine coracana subsp. coracana]|uniref:Reverse transcriptase zinc-binding domain-containing protein n=1 Tax=Eleusine coracana subsp. coracana TaxID=191504 RepID=A0AAV5FAN1_ELECO|nr:hypothetical protein PR202_gb20530 [Eleusine coracana subsp. coracana]